MTDFEKLYRDCFGDVFRYLCKLSGDRDMAEELTSETFFKAMKSLHSFRGDCDAKLWLLKIARNCFFSHRKRSSLSQSLEALPMDLAGKGSTPEEAAISRLEAERALGLLEALPETQREVFMWRYYGELSFASIGRIFGKSENWACVTYHRARTALKNGLEDDRI